MRRLLSWVVLVLLSFAFYLGIYVLWSLVMLIYTFLYKLSPVVFWAIVVGGGFTLIYIVIGLLAEIVPLIVKWTQNVCHTKNGVRYRVVGISNIIWFSIALLVDIISVINDMPITNPLVAVFVYITMILYGVYLTFSARSIAIKDGPPLTKRERLQAQLDKLDRNNHAESERM